MIEWRKGRCRPRGKGARNEEESARAAASPSECRILWVECDCERLHSPAGEGAEGAMFGRGLSR